MDITELSRVLEGDLLESRSSTSVTKTNFNTSPININCSPRITRSQVQTKKKILLPEYSQTPQPRKRLTGESKNEIEKIYLNKKAKVVHKNLETIYEDPVWKKGNTLLLGTSKVKRSIYLDREFRITSKQKSKLRKLKIKRLGKQMKLRKMTDEEFKNKMLSIENFLNDTEDSISETLGNNCDVAVESRNNIDIVTFQNNKVDTETDDNKDCFITIMEKNKDFTDIHLESKKDCNLKLETDDCIIRCGENDDCLVMN